MTPVAMFCRQVRARSAEHRKAMRAVRRLPGQTISILRQELDSFIRVIFLLAQKDREYRARLIHAAVSGERWTARTSKRYVTDADMVTLATKLHGWTKSAYQFGCAFIHLSHLHDYRERDPLGLISAQKREQILFYLRESHGGPIQPSPTFADVVPFLPKVFEKIAQNLESYLGMLERDGDLDERP